MIKCSNCGWVNPVGLERCVKCNAPLILDVFISYSRKDYVDDGNVIPGNILLKIKDTFKTNGISYWFDEEGIYSGDEFASVLTRAIRNSRIFLFVSSFNSNQSRWTSNEISTALEFGKPIIPFRIDDSPYNDSVMMKIISYDYIECKDEEKAMTKLVRAVKHHLPESPYFGRNRWRNIDVPEGASATIVSFIVGDKVQKHTFTGEDTKDKESIHNSIAEETTGELLADREREEASPNETVMQQESVNNSANKKKGNRIISINARNKGCALSVMVALGIIVLIGFYPFTKNSNIMTEQNQQIAQVNNSGKEYDMAIPPKSASTKAIPPKSASTKAIPRKSASTKSPSIDSCLSGSPPPSPSSQKNENRFIAEILGNKAFDAILRGDYLAAESLSRKGLEKDSTQHWIVTNLAAALLFQGKITEAEKSYRQFKNELRKSFLDDFNEFEKAGVIPEERNKDVEHIRQMLEK